MEIQTQLNKSKKFMTFFKKKMTHLIRFFISLISIIFPMRRENYPSLNNTRMIKGRLFVKHTTFQMVRMMIAGIIGVLQTGEQSGMFQNSA